jgi:ABC-type sugar transport system ATPase subunit
MDVSLEGVRVERDGRVLLDVPSLLLGGGRTVAILGPNGSGKTTLLRVIAGLDRPSAGRVLIGGLPANASRVAYVFQEQVFLRRSVRDNLELGLRLRGLNPTERKVRVEEASRVLGITHLMERRADRLSGGEGRRVSLARAMCLQAPLALLDEPLEGLDRPTYSRLLHELPQLLAAFDATKILVTHNPGRLYVLLRIWSCWSMGKCMLRARSATWRLTRVLEKLRRRLDTLWSSTTESALQYHRTR